jgi:hypothetical protein
VFRSTVDLQAAINRFIDDHNVKPKPFVWTADPEIILDKVARRPPPKKGGFPQLFQQVTLYGRALV